MIDNHNPILSLDPLFNPRSIAIIGASSNPEKPGGVPIVNLVEKWQGKIYPVNPTHEVIKGLKCYPSIMDIPGSVDLAIISVAADHVYDNLEQCVAKGIKAAIIFSSGFAEVGPEGLALQKKITGLAGRTGMRILGPNCLGLLNTNNNLAASFSSIVDLPPVDPKVLGFVSQSGAFGAAIYSTALAEGVGFNYFISVGNEADLEFADFIEYMVHDPQTLLIGGYLEGAKNGDKLRRVAEEALDNNKPILIMKVGRTSAGSRAAASHTGSLAGSDKIYSAFFKQTGIIRINNYTDLIAFTPLFMSKRLPRGRNTAIIASSGGAGVTITDYCESMGLNVVPLREETRKKIDSVLPSFASSRNPIDLTAALMTEPEIMSVTLKAVCEDPDVDIVLVSLNLQIPSGHPVIGKIVQIYKNTDKFVLFLPIKSAKNLVDEVVVEFQKAALPTNYNTTDAIIALAQLVQFGEALERRKQEKYCIAPRSGPRPIISDLIRPGETLSESGAKAVLERYGIPIARQEVAGTREEAVISARRIGYPVAMKVDSPDIPHKTEAGGIRLNLNSDDEVGRAFADIIENVRKYKPGALINGVAVQEMLPEGTEVIIGVTRDPVFGPTIMFGLGGIFVEVLKDVSFRVAPVSRGDAEDMVREIKGSAVLKGVRGKPPADTKAIVDVILKVSDMVTDYRDSIEELDINPLIVYPRGVKAADAMLVARK
ncbi:MAG: acetate--CoA ligase family protein [Actinobacteria bacterium]|nr:acetate--CoA ligase family protein [Actinomycetota bacterium]